MTEPGEFAELEQIVVEGNIDAAIEAIDRDRREAVADADIERLRTLVDLARRLQERAHHAVATNHLAVNIEGSLRTLEGRALLGTNVRMATALSAQPVAAQATAVPAAPPPPGVAIYARTPYRVAAAVVDCAVVWTPFVVAIVVADALKANISNRDLLIAWAGWWAVSRLYYAMCIGGQRGQTLGKALFGIAARDDETLGRIGYKTALGRFYVGPLLAHFRYLTAPFLRWLLFSKSGGPYVTRWRWQDKLAGIVVVRSE